MQDTAQKGGRVEEILGELREIKNLLCMIACNTEQKESNKDTVIKALDEGFHSLNQELQKVFHKET